jgi:large subunit ribosomal protein L10
MSKYVKDLITREMQNRLADVSDALLVDVVGMDVNRTMLLRRQLREKGIQLLVVKNSLAKRAAEGTPLAAAFNGLQGTLALCWGREDLVSTAKEIARLAENKEFTPFRARGGVMDGQPLSAQDVQAVSRWPSRGEQLSLLMGQVLSPGATLSAQLLAPGALLVSQFGKPAAGDEP